jgi:hypothetical protein
LILTPLDYLRAAEAAVADLTKAPDVRPGA